MRKISKIYLVGIAVAGLATIGAQAATSYVLDDNAVSTALNASDGTEPRDNWFANEFTVLPGAEVLNRVDFGVFTTAPGSVADVVIYRVTDPSGNPALGATRIYTQNFTPLTGDGTYWYLQQINLTTPVALNDGDKFLVSVFMPDVIALAPNDKYPYLLDQTVVATGTYWDRSNPNAFNLDDLSGAKPIDQDLSDSTWAPGAGHLIIRATATAIPEPSAFALAGLVAATLVIFRRRAA